MSIANFYTTAFTLSRMDWSGESSALVSGTGFNGHIQQAQPQFTEQAGEAWGKTFLVWCAIGTDVETGDRITVASGEYAGTYSVKNIQTNAVGSNQHLELTVIKDVD